MKRKIRILVSNDDGYDGLGIIALVAELRKIAQVQVVAPQDNQSGASSRITLDKSITVFSPEPDVHVAHGSPAECVQIALQAKGILPWKPDLTITGINNGANLGCDAIHSGTVAAALQSNLAGIPAVAFSLAPISTEYSHHRCYKQKSNILD